jgi:APA family basic amino acid/polyamine antiporter
MDLNKSPTGLKREMGLLGLAATGICSMIGAAINVVPVMIQRNVPGIGPYVLPAYLLAAVPAVLAALSYAILASAMPRAGGSYIYASRALSPYAGFVASFSQWFGLCMGIGVVSYVLPAFLRDMALPLGWETVAHALDVGVVRLVVALVFLWTFVFVNLRGVELYQRTLIVLMFMMFVLGGIVIVAGFMFDHHDFAAAVFAREGRIIPETAPAAFRLTVLLAASGVLFSSFIGFDSIAQAGGEARNPNRSLPLAIGISIVTVGTFYFLFTAAIYHAVPWTYIAEEAQKRDLTAPGLLGYILPPVWTVAIVGGACVSLINDLPAMLLAVSRLMFAWAEDGIFPQGVARVHARRHVPHVAIILSGLTASAGIFGNYLASDFFLGVDILVLSMLVNFLLMCASVISLPWRNPAIARDVRVFSSRRAQVLLAGLGVMILGAFLVTQIWKDLSAEMTWYYHSTFLWIVVMALATIVYAREVRQLHRRGVDVKAIFAVLPPE